MASGKMGIHPHALPLPSGFPWPKVANKVSVVFRFAPPNPFSLRRCLFAATF
ncbi:hypothetical protein PC128_g23484 [Phytophthora cactorum]|nr:hypothetical protein PC128_g23484 [Phytophthora cactorum]